MHITNDHTIEQLQAEFRRQFPYLKIVFYQTANDATAGIGSRHELADHLTIAQLRAQPTNEQHLSITSQTLVRELEDGFLTHYGLHVQVFRKSRKIWLQTISTDDWSLADQNERGREASID